MDDSRVSVPVSEHQTDDPGLRSVHFLVLAERAIFIFVGVMFFVAAFGLGIRALADLWTVLTAPHGQIISAATAFLDIMLLVLMIVELAYTVILSLRGSVLLAEPFLLVGLIAVIRRLLVITIGGVAPGEAPREAALAGGMSGQPIELGILTGVVLVLVFSIVVLRARPFDRGGLTSRSRRKAAEETTR